MFLVNSLDDLFKVSGATLEGTGPRVAQLEADKQDVSTIGTEDCTGQVTGRTLGDGGRWVSCLLECWGLRLLITGTVD